MLQINPVHHMPNIKELDQHLLKQQSWIRGTFSCSR